MTKAQAADAFNRYKPLLSAVTTCFLIVICGVYAAGRDVEKLRSDHAKTKEDVETVKTAVKELPAILRELEKRDDANTQSAARLDTAVKDDRAAIKALQSEIRDVRQVLDRVDQRQQTDAEWIKRALQRIEAGQK